MVAGLVTKSPQDDPRLTFDLWSRRWHLVADGAPIITPAARLLPVLRDGEPAMLKLSLAEDQVDESRMLRWWDGDGAAQVLESDGSALLLERATGKGALADMARSGRDDETCRILCSVAARLHSPRKMPLPKLMPLTENFRELAPAAERHGGILRRCAQTARMLLAEPREVGALHGDLHHDNVLDFGARGWLAIDAKGLVGERGFDFANIFTNPDLADPTQPVATLPGRLSRRLDIVAQSADLERKRLLNWIVAWTGLSASWFLGDGDPLAAIDLRIAEIAAAELDR